MQNELEKFVRVNRDAFDSEEPGDRVWKNIEKTIVTVQGKKHVAYRSVVVKILSVAAVVFVACLCTWYFTAKTNNSSSTGTVAKTTGADTPVQKSQVLPGKTTGNDVAATEAPKDKGATQTNDDNYTQEIFYYTKLSEIKLSELKKIEKDEPALYESFAGEIKKMDDTYRNLQAMLKGNADKEAILNAMLVNLKMQTEILNKQLDIIHTIKQSKNKKDDNNFKNI